MEEFLNHPQLRARGRWCDVRTPGGSIEALRSPVDVQGLEAPMGAVPEVGEHTDRILSDLGFESRTIERWRAEGVV